MPNTVPRPELSKIFTGRMLTLEPPYSCTWLRMILVTLVPCLSGISSWVLALLSTKFQPCELLIPDGVSKQVEPTVATTEEPRESSPESKTATVSGVPEGVSFGQV